MPQIKKLFEFINPESNFFIENISEIIITFGIIKICFAVLLIF